MTRIDRDRTKDTAFDVWNKMESANFWLVMAMRHGGVDDLEKVRAKLTESLAALNAGLAPPLDESAIDGQDEADDAPDFRTEAAE